MPKLPKTPNRLTFAFAFNYVDRAVKEMVARRKFEEAEKLRVVDHFGGVPGECAFCGDPKVARWDHLVPVTEGGETVEGNMVPACASCDDSKQHKDFEAWMLGSAPKSPASRGVGDLRRRIARLRAYPSKFGYAPSTLESRLTPAARRELEDLRQRTAKLRQDWEAFAERNRPK